MVSSGPFHVLCADPPWQFGDKLPGPSRGAEKNYKCLSLAELKAFELPPLAPDAILLLWRVSAMQEEALSVCRAWGFVPKSEIVWRKRTLTNKRHFGMGRYVRAEHETCLIASKGRGNILVKLRNVRSVFSAPTGRHSEKPEAFYTLVESWLEGPYAELFARQERKGWLCLGDELDGSDAL
jgi:N6-adenosine-specific RNA methylase IME4